MDGPPPVLPLPRPPRLARPQGNWPSAARPPAEEITRLYSRVRFGAEPLAEASRVDALLAALDP